MLSRLSPLSLSFLKYWFFRVLRDFFNPSFYYLFSLSCFFLCLSPPAMRVSTVAEILAFTYKSEGLEIGQCNPFDTSMGLLLICSPLLLLRVWRGKRMQWEKPSGATSWELLQPTVEVTHPTGWDRKNTFLCVFLWLLLIPTLPDVPSLSVCALVSLSILVTFHIFPHSQRSFPCCWGTLSFH